MSELAIREEVMRAIPGLTWFGPRFPGLPDGGVQAIFRFDNDYGASVILGVGSYGVELAIVKFQKGAPRTEDGFRDYQDYSTFAEGVLETQDDGIYGYNNAEGLSALLAKISALPSPHEIVEIDGQTRGEIQ